jgi:hypothetical protein
MNEDVGASTDEDIGISRATSRNFFQSAARGSEYRIS